MWIFYYTISRMSDSKFLFFDMDGTLISGSTHKVPQSTIDAINLAKENGHHCFICTGRAYAMAQEYQNDVYLPGIVFCNGAGIAYEGKILETHNIDKDVVNKMIDRCEALGGGYQILTTTYAYQNEYEHNRFANGFVSKYPGLSEEECFLRKGMKRIDDYQGEEVQKIDVEFPSLMTADVFFSGVPASLNTILAGGYFKGMGRGGGEMMRSGITKGRGVERVLEMFSGNAHDAYCFGDSTNDIEMMRTCGTGIAMGNGSEDVKKSCDYVTNDVDHDGIYNAMKHFGLI